MTVSFEAFPKIARLSREIIITEKLDGTNAQVIITEDGEIQAGSRKRLIYPGKDTDNFGFAAWVQDNKEELLKLGPGRHFGEWWGKGIQRGYDLNERKFSLFNVGRWNAENIPSCVDVVPTLFKGIFEYGVVETVMDNLDDYGSVAARGYMYPEGIIIYHTGNGALFKKTFENDDTGKEAA